VIPLHVLVTADEYRRLKQAAAAEDMSMSAWVRQRALAGLRGQSS